MDLKTCRKGHTYRGDENYRASTGRCPHCFRIVQARYNASEAGKARMARYARSDKGADTKARYDQSPKGWLNNLKKRRNKALARRQNRKEAEDS